MGGRFMMREMFGTIMGMGRRIGRGGFKGGKMGR
jgi:hypothetical protein